MSVRIIGTGSYLPKKVADNNFLSTIVDTDDEWIRQRTGIKERHLSNGKEGTTYMAAHAAEAALENAGIGADELDMIIVATVSADTYVPSTSCSVQGAIGAIRATCFDINAACSGFLFALNTAYAYIELVLRLYLERWTGQTEVPAFCLVMDQGLRLFKKMILMWED